MSIDPFNRRDARCKCLTVAQGLAAAIDGRPQTLCPVHQGDEIATENMQAAKSAALLDLDRARERRDEVALIVSPPPACTCVSLRSMVGSHLAGRPPASCPLHNTPLDAA